MIENKSVLITGASSGIGKACALHLDKIGFKVFAGVRKNEDGEKISQLASGKLTPVLLDVTKGESITDTVNLINSQTDFPLFGLVNNAGISISGVLEVTPVEEFRKILEVNVLGLHAVTRAALSLLRKNKGRIVNIGSAASLFSLPGGSSYSASKFAVRAITDSLRLEVRPFGMTVSLIAPGAIKTEIWTKADEYRKKMQQNISPELSDAYKMFKVAADRLHEDIQPSSPLEVAKSVEHALTSKKPKILYLVGGEAKRAYWINKFPRSFVDKMIMKEIQG
ncbi:MAG: hypothetical protein APR63_08415 [Desulfuromonas sp. SDB]|nr:MAG: hypothetical protein APR63_08415 [Desulfuromonas sp. SDB]